MNPETIILAFFSRGPAYGYEMKKAMDLILSREGALNNNALYPRLRALRDAGLIQRTQTARQGASSRIMYRITQKGVRELTERVRRFGEAEAAADDAFFFHYAFFGMLDAGQRRRLLELRLAALEKHLERHSTLTRSYASFLDSPTLANILAYKQKLAADEIAWVRQRLSELDESGLGRKAVKA